MKRLLNIPEEKITVIYNTYDPKKFYRHAQEKIEFIKAKYKLPQNFLLFLASLEPRKNLKAVLNAYKNNKFELPLVIAGAQGWNNEDLKSEIKKLNENVMHIGYVDEMDIGALYSSAHALIYPSLYEGFGLPILEAMACGIPAIASNISSIPEVIGDAGILLNDPENIQEISNAIIQINDNVFYNNLMQKLQNQVDKFSMEKISMQMVALYNKLLSV